MAGSAALPVRRVRSRPGYAVRICRDDGNVVVTVTVIEMGRKRKAKLQRGDGLEGIQHDA